MHDYKFLIPTEQDMQGLGQAFASAVSPEHTAFERTMVVDFDTDGEVEVGKTTFFVGLYRGLGMDVSREELNTEPVSRSGDNVAVVHYDVLDDPDYIPEEDECADINVICREHSEMANGLEETFALAGRKLDSGARLVTVSCSEEEAEQEGFQMFLEQVQHWACE